MTTAHCDAGAAKAGAPGDTPKHPWLVLAVTVLASSLAFIDGSVVNVGLPAIGRDLQAGAADLQWVVNAYLLPLSALLLLGGAAGDRFGRRRLLMLGVLVFGLASVACAFAPSLGLLLAGRALQGVGAAMLMPNSLAILGAAFSGEAKGRAVGTWAAVGAMAGAVGPVIGGWLIDGVGWRAIFLVNIPIVVACLLLAWRTLPPDRRDDDRPLDWQGGLLATLGLGALTWGLTLGSGPEGWDAVAIVAVAAGAALMGGFVWVQHHRGDRAMMPLALFGSSSFIGLSLLTLLLYGALGGLLVLVPYVLIEQAGYSATAAGAALLPFPLILACTSPIMGSVAGRIGSRIPLTVGPMIVGAGFLLATRIGEDGGYWTTVLPAILVIALGMAGAVAPLTTAVLSSVDKQHQGSASGFNSAIARTGGLVATALLGAVLAAKGEGLLTAFRAALVTGAVAAAGAGLCALLLIRAADPQPSQR